jgi:hypothetical protein
MQYWKIIADKLGFVGAPFALLVFVVAAAFAKSPTPEVIFISPCECEGFHGIHRWIAKTDLTPVPLDKSAIQSVTPSQVYAWEGLAPDVDLASTVMPSEEKWYAHTIAFGGVFIRIASVQKRHSCTLRLSGELHIKNSALQTFLPRY